MVDYGVDIGGINILTTEMVKWFNKLNLQSWKP